MEHWIEARVTRRDKAPDEKDEWTRTGPFTSRDEVERTLRGMMSTGQFLEGNIVSEDV